MLKQTNQTLNVRRKDILADDCDIVGNNLQICGNSNTIRGNHIVVSGLNNKIKGFNNTVYGRGNKIEGKNSKEIEGNVIQLKGKYNHIDKIIEEQQQAPTLLQRSLHELEQSYIVMIQISNTLGITCFESISFDKTIEWNIFSRQ